MSADRHSTVRGRGARPTDHGGSTLVVIAKAPVPGRVKTRLCPPCDATQAAAVARASLSDTFAAVCATPVDRRVLALEGEPGPWIPPDMEVVAQSSGGLGERLQALFTWSCDEAAGAREPTSATLVVGMDTPQVGSAELVAAVTALGDPGVDAVLGPALDGGYWAIGFTSEVVNRGDGLFLGVPMSTPITARRQLDRLRDLGLAVRVLGEHRDIDRWEDAIAVSRDHPELATSRVVRELGDGNHTDDETTEDEHR